MDKLISAFLVVLIPFCWNYLVGISIADGTVRH